MTKLFLTQTLLLSKSLKFFPDIVSVCFLNRFFGCFVMSAEKMAKVWKIGRRYDCGARMGRLAFSPALANTRIMNKNAFYVPMVHLIEREDDW